MDFYRVRNDQSRDMDGLVTRAAPLSPKTLDVEARSVDVTMATDNPVLIYTYEYGRINEVLLMSGADFDDKIPLLDTHERFSSRAVLGSVDNIKTRKKDMVGRAIFSKVEEDIFTKVEEGHLTDFSVGYTPLEATHVPQGKTENIEGRNYKGPVLVTTKWRVKELSICPIGADKKAKVRANNPKQLEANMDEKTKEMLIKMGMDPKATDEEAWRFFDEATQKRSTPSAPETDVNDPPDDSKIRSDDNVLNLEAVKAHTDEAIKADRSRVAEIAAMGKKFDMAEQAQAAIADGTTVDQFRAKVLETVETKETPADSMRYDISLGMDSKDKFREALTDGLSLRCGVKLDDEKGPRHGGEVFAGYSLREVARECLIRNGLRPPADIVEMVGRSLTTDDFQYALAEVSNKSVNEGFADYDETWSAWCSIGSASDFKTNRLISGSELDDLDEIPEDVEYKYGKMTDEQETYKLVTYGKLFRISRQAIINDDIGILSELPAKRGEAAARKLADLPYAVLTANGNMGDGNPLFDLANHSNLQTNAVVSVDSLNTGYAAMGLQKDIRGLRRLNISPMFYIGPKTTQGTVEQFFLTSNIGTTDSNKQPGLINPYGGNRLTRVYEARLDDDATDAWYLAGPKGKTVRVVFLNGRNTPYLETKQAWNADGVEFKVRIDAAALAVSWRALQKFDEAAES